MGRLLLVPLFISLAVVTCLGYGTDGKGDSHDYHHYYDKVTNIYHHRGYDDDHDDDDDDDDHERRYRFHIGDYELGAYIYLDENGRIKGAYIDYLLAVCKRAGKRCHYLLDDFQRCWTSKGEDEKPGVGLLFNAYDGCLGFLKTPERANSFAFTKAFAPQPKSGLFFKAGSVPDDPTDVTGHKIGFVHGWALNAKCLRRSKEIKGDFEAVFFDNHKALLDAVIGGKVYAGLSTTSFFDKAGRVERGGPSFECGLSGISVITHYGSDVLDWWNKAADALVAEHGWKKLCEAAREKHGDHGEIDCLE